MVDYILQTFEGFEVVEVCRNFSRESLGIPPTAIPSGVTVQLVNFGCVIKVCVFVCSYSQPSAGNSQLKSDSYHVVHSY